MNNPFISPSVFSARTAYAAAVVGSPIEHSLSPLLHNTGYSAVRLASQWSYHRIECSAELLPEIVRCAPENYRGFSVTMPAKFAALSCASDVTQRAAEIGSANTLVRVDGTHWRADNTDCEGIMGSIRELGVSLEGSSVLLLGSGGTARPALWALAHAGVTRLVILNRRDRREELLPITEHSDMRIEYGPLIPDAVPQGIDCVISTVPALALSDALVHAVACAPVMDVIYDPWPTALVRCASERGLPVVGGLTMLAYQAFSQFEQFTGIPAPRDALFATLKKHRAGETL